MMNICRRGSCVSRSALRLISACNLRSSRFLFYKIHTLNGQRITSVVCKQDTQINRCCNDRYLHLSHNRWAYPNHIKVSLPALSPTMETGSLVSWQKKEGDQISEGDILCEIETDKATMGFETPEEGYLAKVLIPEGAKNMPIGKLLCIIVPNKEDVAAFNDYKPTEADDSLPSAPKKAASGLPEHRKVALPALSPTMETGSLVSWQKKEGDQVTEGDLLCEIETDKATMGFETPEEGYLAKVIIPEGAKNIPIGKLLCIIVPNKDDVTSFKDYKPTEAEAIAVTTQQATPLKPTTIKLTPRTQTPKIDMRFPDHTKIALPALSPTMETGNVISWQKQEGQQLSEGDLLCEIETDKATMGFETPEEGYLAKIIIPEGAKQVPIGKLLCIIVQNKEDVAAFKDFKPTEAIDAVEKVTSRLPRQRRDSRYPEHHVVALPALSPTMETGSLVSWQKKEGDQVVEGDLLCEIETDKATMGFETPEEGYLAKVLIQEGTKHIPIGKQLCIIVPNKENVDAFKDYTPDEFQEVPEPVATPPQKIAKEPSKPTVVMGQQERVKVSPYAKKLAAQQGIDLSRLSGTGPGGRILAADLASAPAPTTAAAQPTAAPRATTGYTDIPLSNMRKTIAKRLTESKATIPHYYLTSELNVDNLLSMRKKFNSLLKAEAEKNKEKPLKLSVNDFIVKASALACLHVPEVNSSFMDSFIRQYNNVDVSVAVSTDSGLITPIIFDAHIKGVAAISQEVALLAEKARQGKLQPNEFQGGTFTISNLGMFGSVDYFTAVINPPQSCILAVGAARQVLLPYGDDDDENAKYRMSNVLKVTLSCDHRVVDGAVGAVWLQHFKKFMEEPYTMI